MVKFLNNIDMKVGDRVRVLKNKTGHHYKIGSIVTIREIHVGNVFCLEEVDDYWWSMSLDEFELIETKPKHYQTDTVDVIDFASAYNLNFNRGNVVKYICRAGRKDDELDDLEKARDYINREIEIVKNK